MATELKQLNAIEISEAISKAWQAYIVQEQERVPSKRPYTYASSYEECERKLVLLMTDGDKLPTFEPQTLAKFHRGNDRERNLKIDLSRVGQICDPRFEVIGQQEGFQLKNRKDQVVMSGKFDCRLQFDRFRKPPCELKDWNENLTARIEKFEDCFMNPWTKKGAYQLLMYLLGSGEPFGFLLLGKSGFPALLPVNLEDHIERAEEFLARAERAFEHKEAGTLPDFIKDPSECKRCGFYGSVCDPPMSTEGAQIFTDPEDEQKLVRMIELEAAAEEYADIEKWAKARFRGIEQGIAGTVFISGKWQRDTKYPLTEEAKKQIEAIKNPFKDVVEKGKWFMSCTKL